MKSASIQVEDFTFSAFLAYFAQAELPVTFSDGRQSVYANINDPFPQVAIEAFLKKIDPAFHQSEFTEYIPCIRLSDTQEFEAVVYWRGGLLDHVFILATFDSVGRLLHHRPIAGLHVRNDDVIQSAATITEEWTVVMTEGVRHEDKEILYDPTASRVFQMQITESGELIEG